VQNNQYPRFEKTFADFKLALNEPGNYKLPQLLRTPEEINAKVVVDTELLPPFVSYDPEKLLFTFDPNISIQQKFGILGLHRVCTRILTDNNLLNFEPVNCIRVNITDWPYTVNGKIINVNDNWNDFRIVFDQDIVYPQDFTEKFNEYFVLEFSGGGF